MLSVSRTWLIWLGALLVTLFHAGDDYWWSKWAIGLALISALIAEDIRKRFSWEPAVAFLVVVLNSLWTFAWRHNQYRNIPWNDDLLLEHTTMYALISFLLISICIVHLRLSDWRRLKYAAGFISLSNSLYVLYQWLTNAPYNGGFFDNPSINACLIAYTYPILLDMIWRIKRRYDWIGYPLSMIVLESVSYVAPILAVCVAESSMGVLTMIVVVASYFLARFKVSAKRIIIAAIIFSCLMVIGYLAFPTTLFNSSGRFEMWELFMRVWFEKKQYFFGTGVGTSMVLLPHIQEVHKQVQQHWMIWFHNDYLQALFEMGVPGFLAFVTLTVSALIRSYRTPYLFAAICGYGFSELGNYSVHLFVHAFIGAFLVGLAFRKRYGQE